MVDELTVLRRENSSISELTKKKNESSNITYTYMLIRV